MHSVNQRVLSLSAAAALALTLAACGSNTAQTGSESSGGEEQDLVLSQDQVTLDGQVLSEGEDGAVTLSHDIVYYQEGQGSDYGEGTAEEEHSADEADAHLVVTIREAGTYRVSGELTQGQLAVDLGEDAQDDPTAVVTVILDGVDVTCTVAPAFMVYNVYECGSTDAETASPTVDTAAAGINVVLADGSENTFTGSHVARIYEEGTTDKLHKYDGAFYSKMSMNIGGESEGTGVLNIDGDNEGLDSELHLTINGGVINIRAQNDGINTNEDGVSVTTINGGTLQINAGDQRRPGDRGGRHRLQRASGHQRRQRLLHGQRAQRRRRPGRRRGYSPQRRFCGGPGHPERRGVGGLPAGVYGALLRLHPARRQ